MCCEEAGPQHRPYLIIFTRGGSGAGLVGLSSLPCNGRERERARGGHGMSGTTTGSGSRFDRR